jgi:hypothetical protein
VHAIGLLALLPVVEERAQELVRALAMGKRMGTPPRTLRAGSASVSSSR